MRSNLKALAVILALCAVFVGLSFRDQGPQATLDLPAPKHEVVLVGFGGPEDPDIDAIANFIGTHTGIQPTIGADVEFTIPDMDRCVNRDRHQWDADEILQLVEVPEGSVVIAFFNDSLYTSGIPQWRYCFGLKESNRAILSPANMESEDPAKTQERLNKMALRYVLEMAYKMPRKDDPNSLLRASIMGPTDLDLIQIKI